jgi:hypothetical protein
VVALFSSQAFRGTFCRNLDAVFWLYPFLIGKKQGKKAEYRRNRKQFLV